MKSEVLEFIHRRFPIDCKWLDGNCFYFALILRLRFNGEIYYDVINGHFATMIAGKRYDWTGEIKETDNMKWVKWNEFEKYDKYQFKRIVRDCIK